MIDTVIFDLGGVLVDFHPLQGLQTLGFSKDAMAVFKEKIFAGLWEECDGYPLSDEAIRAKFKDAVPGYEQEVDQLWDHITVITGVYEYSAHWVKSLKKRGYQVYILSNFGQRAFEVNSRLYSFLDDVDGKVISYAERLVKPQPEIYECLMKRYRIDPAKAVFIDDRPVNIEGAVSCGFHGIVFESYEQANTELEKLLGE